MIATSGRKGGGLVGRMGGVVRTGRRGVYGLYDEAMYELYEIWAGCIEWRYGVDDRYGGITRSLEMYKDSPQIGIFGYRQVSRQKGMHPMISSPLPLTILLFMFLFLHLVDTALKAVRKVRDIARRGSFPV